MGSDDTFEDLVVGEESHPPLPGQSDNCLHPEGDLTVDELSAYRALDSQCAISAHADDVPCGPDCQVVCRLAPGEVVRFHGQTIRNELDEEMVVTIGRPDLEHVDSIRRAGGA